MKKNLLFPLILTGSALMAQQITKSENAPTNDPIYVTHWTGNFPYELPEVKRTVDSNRVEFGERFNSDNKTVHITWTLWYPSNPFGSRIVNDMDVYRDIPIDKVRQFEDSIRTDADKKFKFLDSLRK